VFCEELLEGQGFAGGRPREREDRARGCLRECSAYAIQQGNSVGDLIVLCVRQIEHSSTRAKSSSAAEDHNLSATRNHNHNSITRSRSHTSLKHKDTTPRIRRKNSTATPQQQ
jgi:hypothetical protein